MIKVNGTIQEVTRELRRQNPDWDTHYPANITNESPSLNKRNFEVSGAICWDPWPTCSLKRIREGIAYLRRVRGLPTLGPGHGKCTRVSCSYESAIWWCNDVSLNFFTSEIRSYIDKDCKGPPQQNHPRWFQRYRRRRLYAA